MSVFGIERRRTGALPVALVLGVVGVVLTATSQPPISPFGSWSASWAGGIRWLDDLDIVLGPLAAVAAAWVGGRERRRGLTELLTTTPRPESRRTLLTWVSLTSGVVVGMGLVSAFVALGIAPSVSYGGGRWPVSWVLVVAGVVTCSAFGYLVGRMVGGRLVAPLAGVVVYVVVGVIDYLDGSWRQLLPVAHLPVFEGTMLRPWAALAYAGWVVALIATLVLLAAGRRARGPAAALLVVAALAAVPLLADGTWNQPDPGASRLVCTRSGPQVCLTRVHAGLLPSVAPQARRLLATARTVLPVDRVVEQPVTARDRRIVDGVLPLDNLGESSRLLRPGLAHPENLVPQTGANLALIACGNTNTDAFFPTKDLTSSVAALLISGRLLDQPLHPAQVRAMHDRLLAQPGAARTWMTAYLQASRRCDLSALTDLSDVTQVGR